MHKKERPIGRLMIVDDDSGVAETLRAVFETENFSADVFFNGKSALEAFRENYYDIGLIDLKLPDIEGIDLIKELVKINPATNYLLITGYESTESAIEAVKIEQVISYERKTLDFNHIFAIVLQTIKRRKAEQRFQYAALAGSDFIYEWDIREDTIEWFGSIDKNLGLNPETIPGTVQEWLALIHPDDVEKIKMSADYHKNSAEPIDTQYRIRHADGSWRYWVDRALPVVGNDGNPMIWVGACMDITARIEAEEEGKNLSYQLRQSQKMESVGNLAGGVAHDFNNILTAIRGSADLAMEELEEDSSLYSDLMDIRNETDKAANLTKQLLIFSKEHVVDIGPVDINSIVSGMSKMLSRIISEDIVFDNELQGDIWLFKGNHSNIEQIVMNLSINAGEAMPSGGQLHVKTENAVLTVENLTKKVNARPGEYVCLTVEDTGTGIAEDIREHIFEPFFTTKEKGVGTGLGLSVVFGIVQQHGGWIDIVSEPGRGAAFKVYFKRLIQDNKTAASGISVKSAGDLRGAGERILLVEDEESVRKVIEKILARNGYEVVAAGSAGEAKDIFAASGGNFQVVFSDMILPDVNGLELIKELSVSDTDVRFLLGSGYTDDKVDHEEIKAKGIAFLYKPYDKEKLLETIRNILG